MRVVDESLQAALAVLAGTLNWMHSVTEFCV